MLRRRRCAESPARMREMLLLMLPLMVLLLLPRAARAEEAPPSRPYAVLKAQNLVLMGSVFGILLLAMVLMAICVYKPIRRR